jgi:Flp pilus assembly protein CpaB
MTPSAETAQLLVARADVPPYSVLTAQDLGVLQVPKDAASVPGYVRDPKQVIGKVSLGPLPAGLPIPEKLLTDVSQFRLAPADQEMFVLPISPATAVGGQLKVGQKVRVYDMHYDDANLLATSTLIAELPVLALLDSGGKPVLSSLPLGSGSSGAPALLVSAALPSDAQRILGAIATVQKSGDTLSMTLAPLAKTSIESSPTAAAGAAPTPAETQP